MSFTRKSIADHLDSYDDEISSLQESKRELMQVYRAQLAEKGFGKTVIKAEVEALKVAMRRRRAVGKKGAEEVENADALADEIFVEISAPAPRATRTHGIIEQFDAATGEITEQPETADEVPAQDGGGTATGESPSDKSNAARPASVDAHVNGGRLAGEVSNEVVTAGETASSEVAQAEAAGQGSAPVQVSNPALATIPDDDVPAFLKMDRAERNERCEKPLTCQFGHHPQKITCSTCSTAWAIAQRKARAA